MFLISSTFYQCGTEVEFVSYDRWLMVGFDWFPSFLIFVAIGSSPVYNQVNKTFLRISPGEQRAIFFFFLDYQSEENLYI